MLPQYDISDWQVLIIDDAEDNAFVVRRILEHIGAKKVLTVNNGEAGLRILQEFEPSFILLDLAMPKMNGYVVKDTVRQNSETADLIIIAITAHVAPNEKENMLKQGFNGCIIKPFDVASLVPEIVNYLPEELIKYKN